MTENKNKSNSKGIFYAVIGVATLVIAIIGATFAFFTAQATVTGTESLTGNVTSLGFSATVSLIQGSSNGIIPMTDAMIEEAVKYDSSSSSHQLCKDVNGNDVCYIYAVNLTNNSKAPINLDGYIDLSESFDGDDSTQSTNENEIKWIQVFPSGSGYAAEGSADFLAAASSAVSGADDGENALSSTTLDLGANEEAGTVNDTSAYKTAIYTLDGTSYSFMTKNYARTSKTDAELLVTTDGEGKPTTTTLIDTSKFASMSDTVQPNYAYFKNMYLAAADTTGASKTVYFAVWLSENGTSQDEVQDTISNATTSLFTGEAYFQSAGTGSTGGISATFGGSTRFAG